MKKIKIFLISSLIGVLLCSCSDSKITLKSGQYEYANNETAESTLPIYFLLTINEDGTYGYSESIASSSVTRGTWTISDGKLVLEDELGTNYFNIQDGKLTFISENSDNYTYVEVQDGEEFLFVEE